ncbi:MAG: TetR/AcrR family transcriptional regulator [Nitrospirota bacterium]
MNAAADTREKLINSALDLIYARSYAGVGVQELCERAGVNKGSFYHFFPSKLDLILAALDRQWDMARAKIFEPAFARDVPPLKRIERCFDLFYESQCDVKEKTGKVFGCPFGNLALELSTQETAIRRRVEKIFAEMTGYFERALQEAVTEGEIAEQDATKTAQAVVAFKQGVLLMAKTRNEPELISRLGREFLGRLAANVGEQASANPRSRA